LNAADCSGVCGHRAWPARRPYPISLQWREGEDAAKNAARAAAARSRRTAARRRCRARVARVGGVFAGHSRQIAGDLPGAHLNYGPNFPDLFRRAAETVDKILRGAKPADIPVEQPTKFDLVINLTTAKALGLAIPHNVLVLADEVIE
jgi:hypothetical protein